MILAVTGCTSYEPPIITATHLIEDSAQVLERFQRDPVLRQYLELMPKARAVIVLPRLNEHGTAPGFDVGSGVFITRTKDGGWSGPSFHSLIATGHGRVFGRTGRALVMIVRSAPALASIIEHQGRIGATVDAKVGIVGAANHVSVIHDPDVKIVVFADTGTVEYLDDTLENAQLAARQDLNEGLYGRGANPHAIFHGAVGEPATNHSPATTRRLRRALGAN